MPITAKDFENIQVLKNSGVKHRLKMYCVENKMTFTQAIEKLLGDFNINK